MWGTGKAVIRRKLIALNSYIRKEDVKSVTKVSYVTINLRKITTLNTKQAKSKGIMKTRTEINKIKNKKIEKIQ